MPNPFRSARDAWLTLRARLPRLFLRGRTTRASPPDVYDVRRAGLLIAQHFGHPTPTVMDMLYGELIASWVVVPVAGQTEEEARIQAVNDLTNEIVAALDHDGVIVLINSVDTLERFVARADDFESQDGLQVVEMAVSLPLDLDYDTQLLRRALCLAGSLDTLALFLPHSAPLSILVGIHFPRLRAFSTNLPHRILPAFLSTHRSISTLVLKACRDLHASHCSLQVLPLAYISTLQCQAQCFFDIGLERLIRIANQDGFGSLPSSTLEISAGATLRRLTIDVYADGDFPCLSLLPSMAPSLRELTINEKPRSQFLNRPWENCGEWHKILKGLLLLRSFKLRTLVPVGGHQYDEPAVVMTWANGDDPEGSVPHENLSSLSFDYVPPLPILEAQTTTRLNHDSHSDTEVADERFASERGKSWPVNDNIIALRSRVALLQLELTLLQSQRTSDRAKIKRLEGDISLLRQAARDLVDRLQRIGTQLQRLSASEDLKSASNLAISPRTQFGLQYIGASMDCDVDMF
ncbi:hypothetical protein BD311DRAFT_807052 [Dichomitus squalens]|uniref:Uncharacterized protein n=1 Tax=Dichomitus squalens TaxID=114155 RepID=A0A4Q9MP82_9APHY|nr:hypothetical protein BD311DRAFT_807052 [Dichomitus squalens]